MKTTPLSIRKKLALSLFARMRKNETNLHVLNYILWECTLRCNLACIHCGSDCKKDTTVRDMPAEDFLGAIDKLKNTVNANSTMIVLTGGEALMRKDLEYVGQQLYNRGFPWGIVTNGMLLTRQKLQALLHSGLRAVTVSLDGLEDSHNLLRGSNISFSRALNAIRLLKNIPDLRYDVVSCVNQMNYSQLTDLKDLLIENGVKEWRIFTIFPIGRAAQDGQLQLKATEFKGLFDFIKQTRSENKIKLNYGCEGFLGNYEREVRDNFFFCRAGINIASVLVDGSISACPNLRENFIQGNIYQDDIAWVWQDRFQLFRDKSWTRTGLCASCDYYKYCEGSGMHLRDEKTGELLFCHLHRLKEART